MESSRQGLLNDMAEHRSILKNNQNTYHPRSGFTPKAGIASLKTGFCFYCDQTILRTRNHFYRRLSFPPNLMLGVKYFVLPFGEKNLS